MQRTTRRVRSHRVNADIGAKPSGFLFKEEHRDIKRPEIIGLAGNVIACKIEKILQKDEDNSPTRSEKPGTLSRHNTHWSGTENHYRIPGSDPAHLSSLVAGWNNVREQNRIVRVHFGRDNRGPHVSVRHTHVLGLSAVITPCRV